MRDYPWTPEKTTLDVPCRRCGGTGDAEDDDREAGRLTCARCFGAGTVPALVVEERVT